MPLSVVDLYQKILPRTNCRECGFPTCLAFASMVVSEKHPLENCPHIPPEVLAEAKKELAAQYAAGKWTKRDMAEDALQWAKERAASMAIADLPDRIGGELVETEGESALKLPYFTGAVLIREGTIVHADGTDLNRWEQVFLFNHLAQGGRAVPTGRWKSLEEFPNTISKVKSMRAHVEGPLSECFTGRGADLRRAAEAIGGVDRTGAMGSADVALELRPLPRVPVMVMLWDADEEEGMAATVKLRFDETITQHLDIESILFLSERIQQLLCDNRSGS
jgi:hypothetical protein